MEIFKICSPQTLCHPDETVFSGRSVFCISCRRVVHPDVNEFLSVLNPHESICVAQVYADHTGDIADLRCKIPMENMPNIFPVENVFVNYTILVQCVHLLGIMNSGGFVDYSPADFFDRTAALNIKIVDGFLNKFSELIHRHPSSTATETAHLVKILDHMMNYMKKCSVAFNDENNSIIDTFLNVYTPYVLQEGVTGKERVNIDTKLTLEKFRTVNSDANRIRRVFSRRSIHFEVVYVLVYVYLFVENIEVVVNIVLNLLAQICRTNDYFFLPQRDRYRQYFDFQLNKVHNNALLRRRVAVLGSEGCREYISVDFLRDMQQLYDLYESGFGNQFRGDTNDRLIAYSLSQSFPSILFDRDDEYYAYVLCMPVLKQGYDPKNGVLAKNTVSKCKKVVDFAREFIRRFHDFGEKDLYWTPDVFQMFITTDEEFKNSFVEFLNLFILNIGGYE